MANFSRNFTAGKMNKVVDERLVPNGEYIDALNIRMGSTENSEIGVIENTKGNLPLTTLSYNGTNLSSSARCIGAFADSANETIYWFVHDSNFTVGATGKLDLIVSVNIITSVLTYHIISIDDGAGIDTTLNFNTLYLITGVNKVDDLLFFTDDYNAPRFINVKRGYANPVVNIDQFSAESILVIKKPPIESPDVSLLNTPVDDEQFMVDRFICFAYRYRYADNEYSATSQWSAPAFIPNTFNFSPESMLNEGMTNSINTAVVTYNSGGNLVVGVDLLFKEAGSNVIKVIEKLDKSDLGLIDNTDYTYTFTNSKIFTVLNDSEILRLYDNVPLQAKAQTLMGNRLFYGNYVEGYDMVDLLGNNVQLTYEADLITEAVDVQILNTAKLPSSYTVIAIPNTINDSRVYVDFSGVDLSEGAIFTLDFTFTHDDFQGTSPFPTQTTQDIDISFSFLLPTTYASVYDMVTSTEFVNAVGTAFNIQPMPTACSGITLTDLFNCSLPNNLDSFTKTISAYSGYSNQPFYVFGNPSSTLVYFTLPATLYMSGTQQVVEYYKFTTVSALFQEIGDSRSLHSNRGYEVGIVYMDEFNRSTTALVSPNNTVSVPCSYSPNKNSIHITIPTSQKPPYWASRYKFVIKADEDTYETIYSNIYFNDPDTNSTFFLLEGENARKVQVGDRLIVKKDSNGPTQNCTFTTVLEKEAQQANFISITNTTVPAGTYMKINANNFSTIRDESSIIAPGLKYGCAVNSGDYPVLQYPMNIEDPSNPGTYIDYDIPAGSVITLSFDIRREGAGDGDNSCERRVWTLDKTLISSSSYANMKDWWDGENVSNILSQGTFEVGGSGNCPITNTYIPTLASTYLSVPTDVCENFFQFVRYTSNNALVLVATGTVRCSGWGFPNGRKSCVNMKMSVVRADSIVVFETIPVDTLPDVFYENNLSLPIINGEHQGNIQNQDFALNQPAIIDTEFFNCFAFGNGVESYKIRDSIIGKQFNLGNRVTSVSAQDYKRIDRFADLTYSGVYNDESNINRLNEFNLGLLNFKPLEDSFGDIQLIDARQTNILVLQEDKISYVLTGKNLLTDAGGEGALTSVPEVLGNQIARTEEYGISFNPESYVQWGYDRFFTDAKRGAVIQLKGGGEASDQLNVVSEMGMRTWFRDLFIDSFATQKLGGFDPYLNEYVLSSNDIPIPNIEDCLNCGITQTFTITGEKGDKIEYCVDLGFAVGNVEIVYNVINIGPSSDFTINATYNSITTTTGPVTTSGVLNINKNTNAVNQLTLELLSDPSVVLQITVNCPEATELTVIEVVLTNSSEAGDTTHIEYNYVNGVYTSPTQSYGISFASGSSNPIVSRYNSITGDQGTGSIPVDSSTIRIASNQIGSDSFVFDPLSDKFYYLRTNTLYTNTPVDILALLSASSLATPILGSGGYYYADFNAGTSDQYLYLIWDYREATPLDLCNGATIDDVCCNCNPCIDPCSAWNVDATSASADVRYMDCATETLTTVTVLIGEPITICGLSSFEPVIVSGTANITLIQECGCPT